MLLIAADELRTFDHDEDTHREAQSLVTDAYRKAREDLSPTQAFDEALKAYRAKFPHIPRRTSRARRSPASSPPPTYKARERTAARFRSPAPDRGRPARPKPFHSLWAVARCHCERSEAISCRRSSAGRGGHGQLQRVAAACPLRLFAAGWLDGNAFFT